MGLYTVTGGAVSNPGDINQLVGAVSGTITPTLLGMTTAVTTTVPLSSLAVSVPAGVQNGALLVLAISNSQQAPTGGLTGWTSIGTSSGASGVTLYTYYRIANNEPASYTVTFGSTATIAMVMACYAGITGVPLRTSGTTTGIGGTTTATPPTLTGVTSSDLVLIMAGTRPDSAGAYTLTMPHISEWSSLGNAVATDTTFAAECGISALVGGTTTPAVTTSASCEFGIVSVAFITGTDITVNGPVSAGLAGGVGAYALTGTVTQSSPGAPFTGTLPGTQQMSLQQGGPIFVSTRATGTGNYVARMHQTVTQSITTAGEVFSFDTVDFDPRAMIGPLPGSSPIVNAFLIPFLGTWHFVGAIHSNTANSQLTTLNIIQWPVSGATPGGGGSSLVATSDFKDPIITTGTVTGYTFAFTTRIGPCWVAANSGFTPNSAWSTDVTNPSRTYLTVYAQP